MGSEIPLPCTVKEIKSRLREILMVLCEWQDIRIIEGAICSDHVHMYLSVPPKHSPSFVRGWIGYFHLIETWTVLRDLDSWMRRRLRCFMVKQWIKNCHTRYRNLTHLGVGRDQARMAAGSSKRPWALSNMKPLKIALSNRFFADVKLDESA
jgi:hypothetical protein